MGIPSSRRFTHVFTASVLIAGFIALCALFFEFTLDDAYITVRYGSHLAQGHGVVWNVGADPVEGYTSTLWMLASAAAVVAGHPPVLTIKIAGVTAAVTTAVLVAYYGYRVEAPLGLRLAAVAAVAASPALAVLAVQGMETTVAMLFVACASVATLQLSPRFDRRWGAALGLALLLGMLTRPELVLFAGGVLAMLTGYYWWTGVRRDATRLFAVGVLFLLIPGLVFIAARWWYFGYPFPNSFYIKSAEGLISRLGTFRVGEFLTVVIGPVLPVALYAAVTDATSNDALRSDLIRGSPLIVGTGLFLLVWTVIDPIQGFLWRFQTPVLPAILLFALFLTRDVQTLRVRSPVSAHDLLTLVVILSLVGFPLHSFDDATTEINNRGQTDRVEIGQQLAPLADEDYRMLVTESGAVPYYSGWTAIDVLGLNSERIAHQGLSRAYLREFDPDLVMLLVTPQEGLYLRRPTVARFLQRYDYRLVTVVQKSGRNDRYHVYFVRPDSSGTREIACALLETRTVEHVSREPFVDLATVNVSTTNVDRADCTQV